MKYLTNFQNAQTIQASTKNKTRYKLNFNCLKGEIVISLFAQVCFLVLFTEGGIEKSSIPRPKFFIKLGVFRAVPHQSCLSTNELSKDRFVYTQ